MVTLVKELSGQTNPSTNADGDGHLKGNKAKDLGDFFVVKKHLGRIGKNKLIPCFSSNGNGSTDFNDLVRVFKEA